MLKNLSKLEKACLVIGIVESVAGFGMAMMAHHKLMKQADETMERMRQDNEAIKNLFEELED